MSEQGWRGFLAASGVEDWVVLHGGATALFRVGSLGEAARLGEAVARTPGLEGSGAVVTMTDAAVTVRLTRDLWELEPRHVELARAVSGVARMHGASADRSAVQEVQLAIAARPDATDVGFWRAALGYAPRADDNAVDPLGHGSTVWMQELDQARPLRHAMHLDVSVAREHVSARIEAALAAGGRVVDDSHAPSHWTLADRAGNRVCICAWPDQLDRTPAEEAAWPPRAGRETTPETEPGGVGFRPLAEGDWFALRTATLANVNWAGEERFTHRDIDERAELRHYVDLRPDRGDFGYAAEGMSGIVGVVWLLFLPAESPGYGFVANGVPELSVSVWPGHRGRGIGERLMRLALAEALRRGVERVSLSVEPENPSRHLYRKLGFLPVDGSLHGTHVVELRRATI